MEFKVKLKAVFVLILVVLPAVFLPFSASSANAAIISNSGTYKAVLADYDDCLNSSQEAQILSLMENVANEVGCHVGIVITADLEGLSDEQYADSFGYDYFGDTSWIVLMLLNTHGNPAYSRYTDVISSNKNADDIYYSRHKNLFNALYRGLEKSDGSYDFYAGCHHYISALETYGGKGPGAAFTRFVTFIFEHIMSIFVGIVAGVIIALFSVMGTVSGYKRKKPISASVYLDHNRTNVTRRADVFIREYTTSHTSSSSSGGHGGGHHGGGGHHSSHGHHR